MTMRVMTYKCRKCKESIYSRCTEEKKTCSCGNLTVKAGTFQGMTWVSTGIESNFKSIETNVEYIAYIDWKVLKKDYLDKTDKYGLVKKPSPVQMVKANGEKEECCDAPNCVDNEK